MSHPHRLFAALLVGPALLPLGACAGERGYPSLARLPAERIAPPTPAAPPAPVAVEPLPPETAARAQRLADMVRAAHDRFAALAARGGGVLSDLEVARGQTSLALAMLERLYADDRIAHGEADGEAGPGAAPRPAAVLLDRLRAEGLALLASEDAVLAGKAG